MTRDHVEIPEKRMFRLDEVAALVGVSRWTVQRMVQSGDLPAVQIRPRMRRVHRSDLLRFIGKVQPNR